MGLLKNKKAVEGLPLKYIIIALVAALVVGIALKMVGVVGESIDTSSGIIANRTVEETICTLDNEEPNIIINESTTECDTNDITVIATITDDCGIDDDRISFIDNANDEWTDMTLQSGDKNNGIWIGSIEDGNNCEGEILTISVYDKATTPNQETESIELS